MKIILTIADSEDGQVEVTKERLPNAGESINFVTTATALANAMLDVMPGLSEADD